MGKFRRSQEHCKTSSRKIDKKFNQNFSIKLINRFSMKLIYHFYLKKVNDAKLIDKNSSYKTQRRTRQVEIKFLGKT